MGQRQKVIVLGDDREFVFLRVLSNVRIGRPQHVRVGNVNRARKYVEQLRNETTRKVLVEQQFHAAALRLTIRFWLSAA